MLFRSNPADSNLYTDQPFTLTVNQAPNITSANSVGFQVGQAATPFQFAATGFPAPSFSTSGTLPTGVTLSSTGELAGTPAAGTGGTYAFTVTASNGVGAAATQSFTLTVGDAPAFTSANAATFTLGAAGSFTFSASGFPAPTFSVSSADSATLSGIGLSLSNGVLSGTPTGSGGVTNITVTASNGVGTDATQSFSITVNKAPSITTTGNPGFQVGQSGSFTIQASGYPAASFSTRPEISPVPAAVSAPAVAPDDAIAASKVITMSRWTRYSGAAFMGNLITGCAPATQENLGVRNSMSGRKIGRAHV